MKVVKDLLWWSICIVLWILILIFYDLYLESIFLKFGWLVGTVGGIAFIYLWVIIPMISAETIIGSVLRLK